MKHDKRIDPPTLTDLMVLRCGHLGIQTQEMCDLIGISKTYFVSLVNGNKRTESITAPTLRKIAKFLGRSLVEIELVAGVKSPEDFFSDTDLNSSLFSVYRMMNADPSINQYLAITSREWNDLPQNIQVLIAILYEAKLKKDLLIRPELLQKKTKKKSA